MALGHIDDRPLHLKNAKFKMGKLPDAAGILAFLIFNLLILNWSNPNMPSLICVHLRLSAVEFSSLWFILFGG